MKYSRTSVKESSDVPGLQVYLNQIIPRAWGCEVRSSTPYSSVLSLSQSNAIPPPVIGREAVAVVRMHNP